MRQSPLGVCFVAPELDRIGGYELATVQLARSLRQQGVRVSIVTTTVASSKTETAPELIRIVMQGSHPLFCVFPKLLALLARMRLTYSVIHCPTFSPLSALTVLAGRMLWRPALIRVATENDVREFTEARHWKSCLFLRLLRGAAGVIAPSAAIKDELSKTGFSTDKIIVLPNGVDVKRFRPATPLEKAEAKSALDLSDEICVIGTIARLVSRKGIDVLLRAFRALGQGRSAQLLIVGDGPLRDELCGLARQLGIESSVSWLGLQAHPDKWLRAMDVFAFPSRLEGIPNAVLEAMASGLPIVATKIGGVIDLIQDEVTGLLVPPDDSDALAAALIRLMKDACLRGDLGSRARAQAAEEFSLDVVISRLIDLYSGIAQPSRQ